MITKSDNKNYCMKKESRRHWAGLERNRKDWIGGYRIGGNLAESEETKRNQRELKKTRESWRGSERREKDMEGLERRRVDWRQGKTERRGLEGIPAGLKQIFILLFISKEVSRKGGVFPRLDTYILVSSTVPRTL